MAGIIRYFIYLLFIAPMNTKQVCGLVGLEGHYENDVRNTYNLTFSINYLSCFHHLSGPVEILRTRKIFKVEISNIFLWMKDKQNLSKICEVEKLIVIQKLK